MSGRSGPTNAGRALSEELKGTVALLVTVAIWGTTFALSKRALRDLVPSELAFLRQAFAVPPILWLAWRERKLGLPLRYVLALSATGMVGFFLFSNLGLARASASVGALVQGLVPVLVALLAVGFLGERLSSRVIAGIALALAGAGVLAWGTLRVESGLGIVFFFLSVLSWSSYAIVGRRLGKRVSAVQATLLPLCLSVFVFSFGPAFESWRSLTVGSVAFAAALGFFGSGVSYATWSYGIARVEAARAGVYSNLVPVIAVLVAWLALGESLTARQALGGAVVIAGALLASTGSASDRSRDSEPAVAA